MTDKNLPTTKTPKKKKKKNVSKEYYSLSEDEMQALIVRAQSHDSKAQERLLEVFHPYFNKYFMLLHHGKIDLSFYDIRRFIGLFVGDKALNYYLARNKLDKDGLSKVRDIMRPIIGMVGRYSSSDEIIQTLQMTFLQCIERYNPTYRDKEGRTFPNGKKSFQVGRMVPVLDKEGNKKQTSDGELILEIEINAFTGEPFVPEDGILIPFSAFIYNYYCFLLSKNVKQFHIGQLGRKTWSFALLGSVQDSDGDPSVIEIDPPDPETVEDQLGAEVIDDAWVWGDTCGPPFDALSIKERQLIKWKYVDGLKASEIKRRITEHPNTTRETLNTIREALRGALEEDD